MKFVISIFFLSCLFTEISFSQTVDAAILMGRYTTQKSDTKTLPTHQSQVFNKSYYNKKKKISDDKSNTRRLPASEQEPDLTITTTKVVQPNMATGKKIEPIPATEINKAQNVANLENIEQKNENKEIPKEQVLIEIKEPSVREQMRQLFSGKGKDVQLFYKENAHPEDVRNNKLEVEFGSKYISNSSKSNYYYRQYVSSYPAMAVKTSVWFVPGFGLSGKFQFAFASAITGNPNDLSKVLTRNENLEFALNFRNYFGISRKANSLEFQLLFLDSKMTVPSDEIYRFGFDSNGLGIGFKMRNPENAFSSTYYGMQFYPKLLHKEITSGTTAKSGTNRENSRIGIEFGQEYILSKDSIISYGFELSNETNSFKGTVTAPDPVSGFSPDGVSVSNTNIGFVLGYRWGR